MKIPSILFLVLLITGCGTTAQQWQNVMTEANQLSAPTRHYVTDPVEVEPVQNQYSNWHLVPGSLSTQNNGSVQYMMNTANGIEYKTCQNLNGGTVYCH